MNFYNGNSGNRTFYRDVNVDYANATNGYTIEFDFAMWYGKRVNSGQTQYKQTQITLYAGSDALFQIGSVDTEDSDPDEKKLIVNGASTNLIFTEGTWYHFTVDVTSSSVAYSVTSNSGTFTSGSKDVSSLLSFTKFNVINGRNGTVRLNNFKIHYEADVTVSEPPTFTYKSYNGANRTYTLTNPNSGGTLYYTTAPAAEAPAVGDAAYSSTTDLSKDVTYSASGTYYAYVVNASNVPSTVTSQTVTAVAPSFANGTYYLKNKEAGAYFAGGQTWGTQAITNNIGHSVLLTFSPLELTYTIDTGLSNGGDNHYLTEYLWCDGAATKWSFAEAGEGYYTISYGGNNLTAGASGATLSLTNGSGDNTKWKLLTEAEWKAENVARLDAATANNGVDATFYIPAANFNRNDNTENAKWQGSPTIGGLDGSGVVSNFNAEKFNGNWNGSGFDLAFNSFDVYQSLTGLKPGAYKLTVDGFYRNGETDDRNAMLYANDYSTPLANIKSSGITEANNDAGLTTANGGYYVPDSQTDAAKAFNSGYYDNELFFVVGATGELTIGVKNDNSVLVDWTVFDNFQLTYYGETVPVSVSSYGYATLCPSYNLDFSGVEGIEACTAEVSADGKISYTKVNTVAAGEGVLLRSTNGGEANVSVPVIASATANAENAFVGVAEKVQLAQSTETGYTNYILSIVDGDFGFFKVNTNGSWVKAGSAYLKVADTVNPANLRGFFPVVDSDVTGIADIKAAKAENGAIYNMAGQRVNGSYKGIVIKNGKKVFVR